MNGGKNFSWLDFFFFLLLLLLLLSSNLASARLLVEKNTADGSISTNGISSCSPDSYIPCRPPHIPHATVDIHGTAHHKTEVETK
ncbi:unnamed protein product [Citrullus colocynthis]|uniref:Transmembrane protein n=1 Tax=Citrullus colocynthis TaxID=252529 RepID=A0ABP0Y9D8_9ROSI